MICTSMTRNLEKSATHKRASPAVPLKTTSQRNVIFTL